MLPERVVSGDGWFMANRGPLNLVYLEGETSPRSFQAYLEALARDIDEWPGHEARSVCYWQTGGVASLDPTSRRALSDVLDSRRDKLRRITRGYAFVTESTVARGILVAVFWLAPPPYPHTVESTALAGFKWLAARDDRIAPTDALALFEGLIREYGTARRRFA